jgi:protein SCO1
VSRGLVWLTIALTLSPITAPAATVADELSEYGFQPHPGAHLPLAAAVVDEEGRPVLLGRFFAGKPVVLVLDYLRCKTLCGLTLDNLAAALDRLPLDAGRDFQVVVVSIDPRDRPADLAAAKRKSLAAYHHSGGGEGWHFLTGAQPAVRSVADTLGFPYRYEPALDQYIHPAGFVVATPDGTISRYLLGVDTQPADLQAALADAAQGKAVGVVERLLLLCHGNNPHLGRYSLTIEVTFIIANLLAMMGGAAAFVAVRRRWHG